MITLANDIIEMNKIDAGSAGKNWENIFTQALNLVGLQFSQNSSSGAMWDIKPQGTGWEKFITDKHVNLKISQTKWLFGTSELSNMLPWNDPEDAKANYDLYIKRIKRLFNRKGVSTTIYLKPKSIKLQDNIIAAVGAGDVETLKTLLVKKNFLATSLGKTYDIRFSINDAGIGSIAVVKGGKVFMRSEKPRLMSGSTMFVGFRSPKPHMTKHPRGVTQKGVANA